jgi:hypothetical protein
MSMDTKVPLLTPEALAKARVKACQDEVLASLKKHECVLDASITISQSSILPSIRIIAIKTPEQKEPTLDIKPKVDNIK